MELGKLTFLCINLICVGAAATAAFLMVMRVQKSGKRRPPVYSEPRIRRSNPLLRIWRKRRDEMYRSAGVTSEEGRTKDERKISHERRGF